MTIHRKESTHPQLLILLLLVSFASVGAVLFTPGLPAITSFFNLSTAEAQLTITTYLVGYALGQLPYGPLANRFGRKKTLYIGISLSILGSLLCAISGSISFGVLVFARFLQALGASVGLKISFTMVADVYNQTDSTKIFSRIIMAFAIMPGLAVAIGGWLIHLLNWQSCFYFLALFGGLMLWLSTRLPETSKSLDSNALNIRSVLHSYGVMFKNPRLVISGLVMGCGSAVVYIFASKAPFIGINLIGLSPKVFGTYNLIPLLGMLSGSILAMKLAGRFSFQFFLLSGILSAFVASFGMLVPFSIGIINSVSLFFPMVFIYMAEAVVFSNISSFGLTNAKNKSNGSAVMNFINLGTTVIAVLLSELIYPESLILMPLSFIFFFSFMLVLWVILKNLDPILE